LFTLLQADERIETKANSKKKAIYKKTKKKWRKIKQNKKKQHYLSNFQVQVKQL
jgi:hypothetical protein